MLFWEARMSCTSLSGKSCLAPGHREALLAGWRDVVALSCMSLPAFSTIRQRKSSSERSGEAGHGTAEVARLSAKAGPGREESCDAWLLAKKQGSR